MAPPGHGFGGQRRRQVVRAHRPHHVQRRGDAGLAQRQRLVDGVDGQARRVRFERSRHRDQTVTVGVGLDDGGEPSRRDERGERRSVPDDRPEVDRDLRVHPVERYDVRRANDETISATGTP